MSTLVRSPILGQSTNDGKRTFFVEEYENFPSRKRTTDIVPNHRPKSA
jgi:hypothetical protein